MTHNTLKNNPKQFSWNKVNLQNQIKRFLVRTPVCQILQTIFIAVLLCNVFNSQEVSHLLKKKIFFHLQDPNDYSHANVTALQLIR